MEEATLFLNVVRDIRAMSFGPNEDHARPLDVDMDSLAFCVGNKSVQDLLAAGTVLSANRFVN